MILVFNLSSFKQLYSETIVCAMISFTDIIWQVFTYFIQNPKKINI